MPPLAAKVAEYAEPTVPLARKIVVSVSGGVLMARLSGFVAVAGVGVAESVTITVIVPLNGAAGVPVIWLPLSVSVEGRPEAENVYGPVPPLAVKVAEYAVPTVPFGSEVVVIVSGAELMVRLSGFVAVAGVGVAESVTITVTVPLNGAAGVPVIWVPLSVSVAGRPDAENV